MCFIALKTIYGTNIIYTYFNQVLDKVSHALIFFRLNAIYYCFKVVFLRG